MGPLYTGPLYTGRNRSVEKEDPVCVERPLRVSRGGDPDMAGRRRWRRWRWAHYEGKISRLPGAPHSCQIYRGICHWCVSPFEEEPQLVSRLSSIAARSTPRGCFRKRYPAGVLPARGQGGVGMAKMQLLSLTHLKITLGLSNASFAQSKTPSSTLD